MLLIHVEVVDAGIVSLDADFSAGAVVVGRLMGVACGKVPPDMHLAGVLETATGVGHVHLGGIGVLAIVGGCPSNDSSLKVGVGEVGTYKGLVVVVPFEVVDGVVVSDDGSFGVIDTHRGGGKLAEGFVEFEGSVVEEFDKALSFDSVFLAV